jgi:hypothetical protein
MCLKNTLRTDRTFFLALSVFFFSIISKNVVQYFYHNLPHGTFPGIA